ncbi:AAA family ATPase [Cytobacillus gottheilii]|uniref:AAA family ATPase n=1 Tax=Cytobacillus gottheilii TaxID=859144 RepID=UPI003CFBB67B
MENGIFLDESIKEKLNLWRGDLKITINNLFGDKNISMDFNYPIKLFVGENGMGKTTLLNTMYYLLTNKLEQLVEIDFESIEVKSGGEVLQIAREDIVIYKSEEIEKFLLKVKRHLRVTEHKLLIEVIKGNSSIEDFFELYREDIERRRPFGTRVIHDILELQHTGKLKDDVDGTLDKIKKVLKSHFIGKVMYFPTYRRIEEDLHKIGYSLNSHVTVTEEDRINENELIKFGMDDVSRLFNSITSDITKSAIEGLKVVTSEMLTQLVNNNLGIPSETKKILLQKDVINLVLERVKNELPSETSKRLKEIILDKEFGEKNSYNEFLLYFLHNFIKIYEKSAGKEDSIRQFCEICNKYLVDKEIQYDEGAVKIGVYRKSNNSVVKLSQLSSGEKQIVSLFAKLYLSSEESFVILFDEPELSLSIKWQKMFLVDILNSNKCSFIFAVTHSPFIYSNELQRFTKPLEVLLEEGELYEC